MFLVEQQGAGTNHGARDFSNLLSLKDCEEGEGEKERETAGRLPSPAVGRSASFDNVLGSTPSSVFSGM